MGQDIAKEGDPLERAYSDFIKGSLAGYDKIWTDYIGNNGKSEPMPIKGLSNKEERNRRLFSQYHYTTLESVLCMRQVVDDISGVSIESLEEQSSLDSYMRAMSLFVAFMAHLGRIKDMVEHMCDLWKGRALAQPFSRFYEERNVVLHDAKAPTRLIENMIAIVVPRSSEKGPRGWEGGLLWSEASMSDLEFIKDYVADTVDECVKRLNDALNSLYSKHIMDLLKTSSLEIEIPPPGTGPSETISG